MDKKGAVLIFSLLMVLVLSILLGVFYSQSVSENQLVTRYADSTRALWLAEAGIARVKSIPGLPGSLSEYNFGGNPNYQYEVDSPTLVDGATDRYTVVSIGTVISNTHIPIIRKIKVIMKLEASTSEFDTPVITTAAEVNYKDTPGNKSIVVPGVENPSPEQLVETESSKTFSDLFGLEPPEMQALAVYQENYYPANSEYSGNTITASGVTWIEVDPLHSPLEIQHLNGSGIVVINGDFTLNGKDEPGDPNATFKGILYVMGYFNMLGNAEISGTVFIQRNAVIGADLTGSCEISYNLVDILDALEGVAGKTTASWMEIQ